MKLLQLNIWMGRLSRQILPLIEREKPDIITAQEVFSTAQPIRFPDATFDIFERMMTAGHFADGYFSPTFNLTVAKQSVGFGNAILSKFPILKRETSFTHGQFQPDMTVADFEPNTRNFQLVTIKTPLGQVHVCNHHGYWEARPEGSAKTYEAMQIVATALRRVEGPLLFAGDLNINPNAETMGLFGSFLKNQTATHGITNTLSPLGKVQNVACDHILTNEQVTVQGFRVLDEIVSDHKALVVEFEI
ncbi:MAG: endonuclease/exonuclease/phosphatase family protein [Candidatus Saccharimonadales bacterium]